MKEFQVKKSDIAKSRLAPAPAPEIGDGEVLLKIDRFAFTANNVTYGVVGEKIGYWRFFPADEGWGSIPVWGFADVVQSKVSDVAVGDRLYGYFPMRPFLKISPTKISETRLLDGASHRAELPPVYNSYARVKAEPGYDRTMDDERILLFPLYATSFCLYDFLLANGFEASQIVILSASSKTAIGLAYALAGDKNAPKSIGVTSAKNTKLVNGVALYEQVVTYDELENIDAKISTVIMDMSGNGAVLDNLHGYLGDNMRYCSNVGVTHWEDNAMGDGFIRERSAMFFAPGHIQQRSKEWGPGEFEKRAMKFWHEAAIKSRDWLTLKRLSGLEVFADHYDSIRRGELSPDQGLLVEL